MSHHCYMSLDIATDRLFTLDAIELEPLPNARQRACIGVWRRVWAMKNVDLVRPENRDREPSRSLNC